VSRDVLELHAESASATVSVGMETKEKARERPFMMMGGAASVGRYFNNSLPNQETITNRFLFHLTGI
jgi:hypothetical protein